MKRMKSRSWLLLITFVVLIYSTSTAQDRNSIRTIVPENTLSADEIKFADHILKDGFSKDHWFTELSFNPEEAELVLNLPDGEAGTWSNERTRQHGNGLYSWRGRTADGLGSATLVYNHGMITGYVTVNPRLTYRIQPVSKNRHIIYRVNQQKRVKEESQENYDKMSSRVLVPSEDLHAPESRQEESSEMKMTGNDCYIRILVGFDAVAGPSLADPIGFALECVELSNTIYAQSQINFEAELAFATIYSDAASEDIDDALAQWELDFDNGFDDVFSDREQYDADFCILITENFDGDYVGLAATIGASYSSAFCVVEDGAAIDNLSFTHEIGHLMGARHDTYVDGSGDYNHGYIIHSEEVRTVMAYNDACEDNGYDCDRIQYFSNPDVDFPGTSKALGNATDAHNERALDENESDFDDFEPIVSDKSFPFPETISGTTYGSVTALNTIHNISLYTISGGAHGVWSAGVELHLDEGFEVISGSEFEGKIAGCNANKMGDAANSTSASPEAGFMLTVFPDPSSTDVNLQFTLQEAGTVRGFLYDLSGRNLLSLVNSKMDAGTHQLSIDVRQIPSGTYLCTITTGHYSEVKKLIVQH